MNARPLDLVGVVAALRRRARLAVLAGLLGAAAGTVFAIGHPSKPVATAVVLLPPAPTDSTGAPLRDMETEVHIATGQSILLQADRQLDLGMSYEQLHRTVSATAPTSQLISISAKASDADTARRLALAVADDYIAYTNDNQTTSNGDLVGSLRGLVTTYTAEVKRLQSEIDTVRARLHTERRTSAAAGSDQQVLTQLESEQTAASVQRTNVQTQLTLAEQGNGGSAARLLQTPSVRWLSRPLHIALFTLGGLLGGLVLAAAGILAGRRSAARLWLSADIADAVGAPTLTWMLPRRLRTAGAARRMVSGGGISETELWRVRRAHQQLALGDPSVTTAPIRLLVLVLDQDKAAFGAAAGFLVALQRHTGMPTSTAGVDSRTTRMLRHAQATTAPASRATDDVRGSVLLAVDRESPSVTPSADAAVTLLAVSSGAATSDDLSRLAMSVLDTGGRISGVIVVDPLPEDLAVSEHRSRPKVDR